eukprot:TRINITY_DN27322_c0_g1_i1.p1 TRINITY_DN27322_c0_g1~~TRINITY_DN27322_c0_g1_i1.p1  ORF type:complete len:435 (+),score=59.37 TRINITY_DN27322_c0_g1_i1:82-1386(+)
MSLPPTSGRKSSEGKYGREGAASAASTALPDSTAISTASTPVPPTLPAGSPRGVRGSNHSLSKQKTQPSIDETTSSSVSPSPRGGHRKTNALTKRFPGLRGSRTSREGALRGDSKTSVLTSKIEESLRGAMMQDLMSPQAGKDKSKLAKGRGPRIGREAWGTGGQGAPRRTASSANGVGAAPSGAAAQQGQAPNGNGVELPSMWGHAPDPADRSPLIRMAFSKVKPERCSRCTIDAVWAACDVFWEFDRDHSGVISRKEYIDLLGDQPTVTRLRVLRRAKLERRFRASAEPLTVEEFLLLMWPKATEADKVIMRRWAQLRQAYDMMQCPKFKGSQQEMEKVYELLRTPCPEGGLKLQAYELQRSLCLRADEVRRLAKGVDIREVWWDIEDYKTLIWPLLRNRWVTRETLIRMKKEEENDNTLGSALRTGRGPGK